MLLPTADIANALLTTLPGHLAQVFGAELADGDLLGAVGLPVAAATGLASIAGGFELISIENAIGQIGADFSALLP